MPDMDPDDQLMLPQLAALGVSVHPAVWDDLAADWASFDLVVIRNTWDYSDRRDEFLSWCDHVETQTRLLNPASIVRWDSDKRYLRDLADAGLPIVPTVFLGPEDDLYAWTPPAGCTDFVVKPTVSVGSRDTMRYAVDGSHDEAQALIDLIVGQGRTAMIQPYLDAVDDEGETALLFIGGVLSHAIRKGQMLRRGEIGAKVAGLFVQENISPRTPSAAQIAMAHDVMANVPGPPGQLLFGRVDLIPDASGEPVLLELELIEPSMFFTHADGAAQRFAEAIVRRLRD
jgi:glutathione synthase/RimK-type ligase-like ATP-grasp enzyme